MRAWQHIWTAQRFRVVIRAAVQKGAAEGKAKEWTDADLGLLVNEVREATYKGDAIEVAVDDWR